MASRENLVEQLQRELKQESFSRQLQEQLNSKLQDEYDVLLKRLAEAESHIDRLRFHPNVEFDKYFIVRHHSEQHSTLRQRLEAQFDPAWRAPSTPGNTNNACRQSYNNIIQVASCGCPKPHADIHTYGSSTLPVRMRKSPETTPTPTSTYILASPDHRCFSVLPIYR